MGFFEGIKKVCKKIEKKVFYDKIKNHRRLFIMARREKN